MDFLFVLGILVLISLPVVLIILVVGMVGLRGRVDRLEYKLAQMVAGTPPEAAPAGETPWDAAARAQAAPAADTKAIARSEPEETAVTPPERPAEPARPAAAEKPTAPPVAPPPPLGPSGFDRALDWARDNWIYVVSAVSLGLAGIFLVQYGIEKGLLTPVMRVTLAILMGLALIGAGEYIRRRWGDEGDSDTAFLPSTFSGAGIVVLYAAVLAARGLYGLIGPELAFAGLVLTSAVAMVFGWFYGPFLAAAGISGAAMAPFLVGGDSNSGMPFYLFYGLLGAVGLAIDAMRRWGWVSLIALGAAYGMGTVVLVQGGEVGGFIALMVWLALAATALPRLQLWPSHPGPTIAEALLGHAKPGEIVPPVWIAGGAVALSSVLIHLAYWDDGADAGYLAMGALAFLVLALALWARGAAGLADLAAVPAVVFIVSLINEAMGYGDMFRIIASYIPAEHPEETPPLIVSHMLALATLGTLAAAWRSGNGRLAAPWAAGAALLAPVTAVAFELFWHPGPAIGPYFWAGHVVALAALMTILAERFARADGEDRRRAAYMVLSALSLIALAMFILLAEAALTVALAVLVVTAAALDRRFKLPEMGLFLTAGVATLGWRLILDPGLDAYLGHAPWGEVILAFGAALAGLWAAMTLLPEDRPNTKALLESSLWAYGGAFLTVVLWRAIDDLVTGDEFSHWSASLTGILWAALALAQYYRLVQGGRLRWLRIPLAIFQALLAAIALLVTLTLLNPWFGSENDYFGMEDSAFGYQPFDTLFVGYALPGLLALVLAAKAGWLRGRVAFRWLGVLFLVLYAFLEIRWFWHGRMGSYLGFSQPELYTYTLALLITGGATLYQAIARHSAGLRRIAMIVIGITVVKVFLVDASGLTGLLRVFSFLALGLALAGLAWLNRWASGQRPETQD